MNKLLWFWIKYSSNINLNHGFVLIIPFVRRGDQWFIGRKEGNVLFNDALNTFYLRLYGVTHMVKDHSDSERGNPLPPHGLIFSINSKGSFICTIAQTGSYIPRPFLHQSWSTGWNESGSLILAIMFLSDIPRCITPITGQFYCETPNQRYNKLTGHPTTMNI